MSLHNALRFVKLAEQSEEERARCYSVESRQELLELLGFSEEEFDNAVNMRLVQCREHEDAMAIQELRFWFALL